MVSVCVVGGGTAGTAAAVEAIRRGADVTVIEKREVPEPPWRVWPQLLSGSPARDWVSPSSARLGVEGEVVRTQVVSISEEAVQITGGRKLLFDYVVLATGTGFEAFQFAGRRKNGVHVLDSARSYAELAVAKGSASSIVVAGEGRRALEVADTLSGGGRRVRVLISRWWTGEPAPEALAVIRESAAACGVEIGGGLVEKSVGVVAVEAVLSNGTVIPCDTLVLVPCRVPQVPPVDAVHGPLGGLLVDVHLASRPGLHGAGGCSELSRPGCTMALDGHPGVSGTVAGANSCGEDIPFAPASREEMKVFGIRWFRERSAACARPEPLHRNTRRVARRWGERSACSISLDLAGVVCEVEGVEDSSCASSNLLPARGTTLRSLVYGRSSDISLVSETARLGLTRWSVC